MSPCSPACGRALRRSSTRKANGCSSGRRSCRADEEGYSFIEPPTLFFTLSFYTSICHPLSILFYFYTWTEQHVIYRTTSAAGRARERASPVPLGTLPQRTAMGDRPRGLFARWDSLGLPPARPGPLARLPLG